MAPYRWLLMDADNTIFNFDAASDQSLRRLFARHGLPADPALEAAYHAINTAIWAEHDKGLIALDDLVVERFRRFFDCRGIEGDPAAWNRAYLDGLAECWTLIDGAAALVRDLARHYTIALITNGVEYVQRRRLADSGLEPLFAGRIFISGSMGCKKPEPAFFEQVLSDLGVGSCRSEVLVVGDGLSSDITGALNVGLDCVWYDPKGADPGGLRPTYRVGSLADLRQLLL